MIASKPKNDKQDDNKQHGKRKQYCCDYILNTLKAANHALTYADFGQTYDYGTLRNKMNGLVKNNEVLSLPKEWPKRFILVEWAHRPEYGCVQRNDKRSTVGRFDYLSYLEGLGWSSPLCVHNLKFCFQVFHYHWVGHDWVYCPENKSYSRRLELSYPVRVQCFDTGSVMVNVRCSARPFPLDNSGLLALCNLLGEVRYALHASCIPEPGDWQIVHWHLNRDSEKLTGGGLDVHLTFRDFFEDAAQFYFKRPLNVIRAEVSQSPKRSVQEVFEKIIDRGSFGKGGL
jgi:hypothetical protein